MCENNKVLNLVVDGRPFKVEDDKIRLSDLAKIFEKDTKGYICMAVIDNKLYDLNHIVYRDEKIYFVDTTSEDGARLYFRGLSLLLVIACRDLFENCRVFIEHSISGGLYCTLKMKRPLNSDDIDKIRQKMREYIESDDEIKSLYMTSSKAIEKFESVKRFEKAELLKYRKEDIAKMYECRGYFDYFYGFMFPSTGYIREFDVRSMADGLVILGPEGGIKNSPPVFNEMKKLSDVYRESEAWSKTLGIKNVVDLNKIIEDNKYPDMIRTVEALHERKIAEIADEISKNNKRVVLIAAPSSSGKTSFAQRLSIQLKVSGYSPLPISIDDYFVNREDTPIDENGEHDYESLEAIDVKKFNEDINDLLNGKEIDKIRFNFLSGKRELTGEKIRLEAGHPIILEGIHGINPLLTKFIDEEMKYKIYISVITQINLDDHNRIPTTDLRLLRRLVRDSNFRGNTAEMTLDKWPSVRRGEDMNIFPYQEEADVMFNSASVYEVSVLKKPAEKLLKEVGEDSVHFVEANRLRKFLQYFDEIEDLRDIGPTSIIREFIGGSRIV